MSIADVAARLSAVLDMIDDARAVLTGAADTIGDATAILSDTLSGSSSNDAQDILALLADAEHDVRDLLATIDNGQRSVQDIRARLFDGATAPPAPLPLEATAQRPSREPPVVDAAPGSDSWVERMREELPPTVQPRAGQKTHGRWTDPSGQVHQEISGRDDKASRAKNFLTGVLGFRYPPMVYTHVEIKLANHLRENEIRSATLVINNLPCDGELGCAELLPVVLPKGYTLTVFGPGGFRQTYTGS